MNTFAQKYGLHPLVALAMICVDTMLFGSDILAVFTEGATLAISIAVAAILTIPCILLQKYAYKDNWGAAIGKGLIVGILTAIPTSLPSIVTGGSGVLGIVGLVKRRTGKKTKAQSRKPVRSRKTK